MIWYDDVPWCSACVEGAFKYLILASAGSTKQLIKTQTCRVDQFYSTSVQSVTSALSAFKISQLSNKTDTDWLLYCSQLLLMDWMSVSREWFLRPLSRCFDVFTPVGWHTLIITRLTSPQWHGGHPQKYSECMFFPLNALTHRWKLKIILKYKRVYGPLHPCLSIILQLCILTKIIINLIQSQYFLLSIYLEQSIYL